MLRNLILLFFVCISSSAFSQTRLPSFFSNQMVLQQNQKVSLWGTDKPNTPIKLETSWGGEASAQSDKNGNWKLSIKTPLAGGPYSLVFKGSETITLNDVLIGEVWLCSGQSNMEMPLKGFANQPINGSNEFILNSANDHIRVFGIEKKASQEPLDDVKGQWIPAGPGTAGDFSATAYFFGKKLNEILDVPIGLIQTSWGGSSVEAWMDKETLSGFTIPSVPNQPAQKTPSLLYNGMLNPFVGYTMKGVIWYQGESNRANANEYQSLFSTMISSWREQWKQGDFPFYFVQIAPYGYGSDSRSEFLSGLLREAQLKTMLTIENTGMAVTLDIGECGSIHPAEKSKVGERLAYWALAKDYQVPGIAFSGPVYREMEVFETNKIKISFDYAPMGLSFFENAPEGFEIAGSDRIFHEAKCIINKDKTLTVWVESVANPVAVRYAFKSCVKGTLYNQEGLPASPFRTDNWE